MPAILSGWVAAYVVSRSGIAHSYQSKAGVPWSGVGSYIELPGGTFTMGSERHYSEEAPAHRVSVDGFSIDVTGFIVSLLIFTVTVALMTPFLATTMRRSQSASAALGGVALISTFVALLITDIFTDGLSISGIGTWIGATVVVWLASLLAVFILPFLGLKKYLDERRV